MNIDQVAAYLHLTKAEVEKLVRRNRIPHEKSGPRVVFRNVDIDAWASQRLLETHHGDAQFITDFHVKASARHFEESRDHAIMPTLLTPQRIDPEMGARTRASVLSEMTMMAADTGLVTDQVDLLESLRKREEMCSTGLPGGIALLHPRHHHEYLFDESFIVLGRAGQPVPFGAPDGKLTDLFFLVCCGDDKLHLHTIARLCAMCNDTSLMSDLRVAETAHDMYDLIVAAEIEIIVNLKS